MFFTFNNYTVDIDIEKTKETYRSLTYLTERCSCDGCLNFEKAIDQLPVKVRTFFDEIGVDLKKAAECYIIFNNDDGSLLYGGFCHLCGRLIQGESAWVRISDNHSYYNPDLSYHITENFSVSFQEECCMMEAPFNPPILQLEFQATMPSVI